MFRTLFQNNSVIGQSLSASKFGPLRRQLGGFDPRRLYFTNRSGEEQLITCQARFLTSFKHAKAANGAGLERHKA